MSSFSPPLLPPLPPSTTLPHPPFPPSTPPPSPPLPPPLPFSPPPSSAVRRLTWRTPWSRNRRCWSTNSGRGWTRWSRRSGKDNGAVYPDNLTCNNYIIQVRCVMTGSATKSLESGWFPNTIEAQFNQHSPAVAYVQESGQETHKKWYSC